MSNPNDQAILIPHPVGQEAELSFKLGPCRILVVPSTGTDWVTGTYTDPTDNLPITVETSGGRSRISHRVQRPKLPSRTAMPTLDLQIGTQQPFGLILETGATSSISIWVGCRFRSSLARLGQGGQNRVRAAQPGGDGVVSYFDRCLRDRGGGPRTQTRRRSRSRVGRRTGVRFRGHVATRLQGPDQCRRGGDRYLRAGRDCSQDHRQNHLGRRAGRRWFSDTRGRVLDAGRCEW